MITEALYTYLIVGWIALAVIVFVLLFFITAPYGRHTKTTWGPLLDNKIAWVLMEVFVLFVLGYFILSGSNTQSTTNWIIIGLFGFHYINRSVIFPFRLKTKGKKMPIMIMLMGMFFNMWNGFFIGYFLGELKVYDSDWLLSPPFLIGVCLFVIGIAINGWADTVLIGLRRPNETGYKIPYGGLFQWVSCPNLLGEIIEWLGFAILMWSLPGWAFFIWTFANLAPRAIAHHHWYREHFPEYPKERKALIPFVW